MYVCLRCGWDMMYRPNVYVIDVCLEGRKEMFYLTMHSTHFIYGFMVSHMW